MARYIDADDLYSRVKTKTNPYGKPTLDYESGVKVLDMIKNTPTADVVPKSEVEALQEALSKAEADVKNYMKVAEYQQSLSVKRYHEIKRLNEDVDRLQEINNRQVENIRLAKQEVAREIFADLDKIVVRKITRGEKIIFDVTGKYEELKKKYTEEKT